MQLEQGNQEQSSLGGQSGNYNFIFMLLTIGESIPTIFVSINYTWLYQFFPFNLPLI